MLIHQKQSPARDVSGSISHCHAIQHALKKLSCSPSHFDPSAHHWVLFPRDITFAAGWAKLCMETSSYQDRLTSPCDSVFIHLIFLPSQLLHEQFCLYFQVTGGEGCIALGVGFSSKDTDSVTRDSPLITTFWDLSVSQFLAHLTCALLMCGALFPHWNAMLYKFNILQASWTYSYVYEPTLQCKRTKPSWYNKTRFP